MKWFKMDCDAQDNLDIRKLVSEWGWDWYGRYMAIIGKVGMLVNENNLSFTLSTNNGEPFPVRLLADDLSTTVQRLSAFCQYLADNRLIDPRAWNSKNLIFIPLMRKRADEYTKKLLTKSRQCPEQEEEVEVEVDKKKKELYTPPPFSDIWNRYPNRQGKRDAERHYRATVKTPEDVEKISKALDNYLASGNVKNGFIKNGSTWFNNWQDWISPTDIMLKGNNGHRQAQPGSQIARASFKHGPEQLQRLESLKATLDERDRERNKRARPS